MEFQRGTGMSTHLLKILMILSLASVMSGCRLEVIVSDGGTVLSQSSVRDCVGPSYCINEIDDPYFNDTFTAVANPGYEFVRWQAGDGFFCGNSTNTTCSFGLEGGPGAESIVASENSTYIMPIFRYVGLDTDGDEIDDRKDDDDDNDLTPDADDLCPRDPDPTCGIGVPIANVDIVTVNGKEWAQPDLFQGVTWSQINAVCPEGPCINGGVLNGHDMTGWRWAHVYEMSVLFNHYNSGINYGTGQQYESDSADAAWILAFFADGWRSLYEIGSFSDANVSGHAWGGVSDGETTYDYATATVEITFGTSLLRIDGYDYPLVSTDRLGGWFYRAD